MINPANDVSVFAAPVKLLVVVGTPTPVIIRLELFAIFGYL